MSVSGQNRERWSRRRLIGALAAGGTLLKGVPAAALSSSRRLTLRRQETGEAADDLLFWRNGQPATDGIAQLDWLLRDVRAGEVTTIDRSLYLLLHVVQADFGGEPLTVTSGFRTWATNEHLRHSGYEAVRNSFHLEGRAVDLKIEGVAPSWIAAVGERLGIGGVGLYPTFVHLDTGPRRRWHG